MMCGSFVADNSRTVQALWLVLANISSLCMTLVISAILSRYMTTVEYGTYRQVIYIYSTLLMIFSFGLPGAYSYFLARVPVEEVQAVIRKFSVLFWGLSSVFSVTLFVGASWIAELLGNPLLTDNLKYFAMTPLLLMQVLCVEHVLTVYGMTHVVLVYALLSRILSVLCSVIPVIFFNTGVPGAIIGLTLASFGSFLVGMRLLTLPFKDVTRRKTDLTTADILRFSMPVFSSSLYGFVIGSASQFFVSRYLGVENFAMFANGYRELPIAGIVIGAVAGILLPEFSRMTKGGSDSKQYLVLWKNVVLKSAAVIYPFSLYCCIFAPEIMGVLYGTVYREAADLFRIVTIINLVRIVPYGPIMFALGKGKIFAKAHLVTALLLLGLDFLCVTFFPSLSAIAIIATTTTVFCLVVLMVSTARLLNTGLSRLMPWKSMFKILSVSTFSCFLGSCAVNLIGVTRDFPALLSGFLISIVIYLPLSYIAGINYARLLKPLVSTNQRK